MSDLNNINILRLEGQTAAANGPLSGGQTTKTGDSEFFDRVIERIEALEAQNDQDNLRLDQIKKRLQDTLDSEKSTAGQNLPAGIKDTDDTTEITSSGNLADGQSPLFPQSIENATVTAPQAPVENTGDAELFQNGTATPLSLGLSDNAGDEIRTDVAAVFGALQQADIAAREQSTLLDNELLAQQLGIDLSQQNTGEPTTQSPFEPADTAQDISAHLNTLTSLQDQAQKPTPAQEGSQNPSLETAEGSSSPLPQADDAALTLANAPVAGEVLSSQINENTVENSIDASIENSIKNGVAQSLTTTIQNEAAARQAQTNDNTNKKTNKTNNKNTNIGNNNAPQNNVGQQNTNNGTQPAQNQTAPSTLSAAKAALETAQAALQNTAGFDSGLGGQDLLSGFTSPTQSGVDFNTQLTQQLRGETVLQQASNGTNTPQTAYRAGTPPQQVLRAVTLSLGRGGPNNTIDQLSLQLEPAELGRVKVDLKLAQDGSLKAHILADKSDALTLLQKDSSSLQRALADAGLDVGSDSFTFDLNQQNDHNLAQDKNAREALFDVSHIDGLEVDDQDLNALIAANYNTQYIKPDAINVYV